MYNSNPIPARILISHLKNLKPGDRGIVAPLDKKTAQHTGKLGRELDSFLSARRDELSPLDEANIQDSDQLCESLNQTADTHERLEGKAKLQNRLMEVGAWTAVASGFGALNVLAHAAWAGNAAVVAAAPLVGIGIGIAVLAATAAKWASNSEARTRESTKALPFGTNSSGHVYRRRAAQVELWKAGLAQESEPLPKLSQLSNHVTIVREALLKNEPVPAGYAQETKGETWVLNERIGQLTRNYSALNGGLDNLDVRQLLNGLAEPGGELKKIDSEWLGPTDEEKATYQAQLPWDQSKEQLPNALGSWLDAKVRQAKPVGLNTNSPESQTSLSAFKSTLLNLHQLFGSDRRITVEDSPYDLSASRGELKTLNSEILKRVVQIEDDLGDFATIASFEDVLGLWNDDSTKTALVQWRMQLRTNSAKRQADKLAKQGLEASSACFSSDSNLEATLAVAT